MCLSVAHVDFLQSQMSISFSFQGTSGVKRPLTWEATRGRPIGETVRACRDAQARSERIRSRSASLQDASEHSAVALLGRL